MNWLGNYLISIVFFSQLVPTNVITMKIDSYSSNLLIRKLVLLLYCIVYCVVCLARRLHAILHDNACITSTLLAVALPSPSCCYWLSVCARARAWLCLPNRNPQSQAPTSPWSVQLACWQLLLLLVDVADLRHTRTHQQHLHHLLCL